MITLPLIFLSLAVSQSLVTNAGHKARAGITLILDRCSETPCVILLSPLPAAGLGTREDAVSSMGAATRR